MTLGNQQRLFSSSLRISYEIKEQSHSVRNFKRRIPNRGKLGLIFSWRKSHMTTELDKKEEAPVQGLQPSVHSVPTTDMWGYFWILSHLKFFLDLLVQSKLFSGKQNCVHTLILFYFFLFCFGVFLIPFQQIYICIYFILWRWPPSLQSYGASWSNGTILWWNLWHCTFLLLPPLTCVFSYCCSFHVLLNMKLKKMANRPHYSYFHYTQVCEVARTALCLKYYMINILSGILQD